MFTSWMNNALSFQQIHKNNNKYYRTVAKFLINIRNAKQIWSISDIPQYYQDDAAIYEIGPIAENVFTSFYSNTRNIS